MHKEGLEVQFINNWGIKEGWLFKIKAGDRDEGNMMIEEMLDRAFYEQNQVWPTNQTFVNSILELREIYLSLQPKEYNLLVITGYILRP